MQDIKHWTFVLLSELSHSDPSTKNQPDSGVQNRNNHELHDHSLVSHLYVKRAAEKKIWNIIKD